MTVSLALVFWRLPTLRSQTKLESVVSLMKRHSSTTTCSARALPDDLLGVVYPLISEAVRGEAVVLGREYYDFFLRIFGLPLLLLMGIGPLIAWRRASLQSLLTTFLWPTGVAAATGLVLLALGAGGRFPA